MTTENEAADDDFAMTDAKEATFVVENAPNTSTLHSNIAYSPNFTDSLVHPVLHPPARQTKINSGVSVLPPHFEGRVKNNAMRYVDLDVGALPIIESEELPLALDDNRRVYASGVPGVKVTHPGGWLEGGVGPHPKLFGGPDVGSAKLEEQPAFVLAFLAKHGITTPDELQKAVKVERDAVVEELRMRMREREEAAERNEKTQARIDELIAEREMERRVHERAREVKEKENKSGI